MARDHKTLFPEAADTPYPGCGLCRSPGAVVTYETVLCGHHALAYLIESLRTEAAVARTGRRRAILAALATYDESPEFPD